MSLILQKLALVRQERILIPPVSCVLSPGECLQVTGANGSGKSTLLRLLAGLMPSTEGTFECSVPVLYVGHRNGLRPELSIKENLRVMAGLSGNAGADLSSLLAKAGLSILRHRPVSTLSAGQARRVSLTRLLIQPEGLWLLDEPATALDTEGKRWLNHLIEQHLATGGMVVMATHDVNPISLESKPLPLPGESRDGVIQFHKTDCQFSFDPPTPTLPRKGEGVPGSLFCNLFRHDLLQAARNRAAWLTPLLFFAMAVTLFSLAAGPDTRLLHAMAPSLLWVIALLAMLLSIDSLFREDRQTGWLDCLLTSPCPLLLPVISRILCHWLSHGLPLVLLCPFLGFLLGLNAHEIKVLACSLLIGTPVLSLTGAIGAALVASIRGQALLLPVLVMPLYIPVLIFGVGSVTAAGWEQPVSAHLALLGALLLFTLTFSPILTGIGLRSGAGQPCGTG